MGDTCLPMPSLAGASNWMQYDADTPTLGKEDCCQTNAGFCGFSPAFTSSMNRQNPCYSRATAETAVGQEPLFCLSKHFRKNLPCESYSACHGVYALYPAWFCV